MQSQKDCKCTVSARDPLCKSEHKTCQVEREIKVEPRMFMPVSLSSESDDTSSDEVISRKPGPLQTREKSTRYSANGRMIEDDGLLLSNRKDLRKFETLNISGRKLTGLSIGGFEVDLNVAAQKAMEVLPMPPAKLPVIFVDEELNFLHHFFQGVTKMIGEHVLNAIAAKKMYYDDESPIVLGMIEDLILDGYDKSDPEIILFLKKVLKSTFDVTPGSRRSRANETVKVSANLYGFQYIESGMMLEEQDLQMWLAVSYNQYRTSWFNTFKSSGVPSFSVEGSGKSRSLSSFSSSSDSSRMLETVKEDDEKSVSSRRSRKSHRSSSHYKQRRPSVSSKTQNSVMKYLAGQ